MLRVFRMNDEEARVVTVIGLPEGPLSRAGLLFIPCWRALVTEDRAPWH
jgi:hypothetical protein